MNGLERVLLRAADDPAFARRLVEDRACALEEVELAPHEKEVLLSADAESLERMIAASRRRRIGRRGAEYTVAGGVILALALPLTATLGHTSSRPHEARATTNLRHIECAQILFISEHGRLATMDEIAAVIGDVLSRGGYTYEVIGDAEDFVVTARHPSRQSFRLTRDGAVESLE